MQTLQSFLAPRRPPTPGTACAPVAKRSIICSLRHQQTHLPGESKGLILQSQRFSHQLPEENKSSVSMPKCPAARSFTAAPERDTHMGFSLTVGILLIAALANVVGSACRAKLVTSLTFSPHLFAFSFPPSSNQTLRN